MKIILLIILMSFTVPVCFAQKRHKILWGVTASANIGQLQDRIEISPNVGFKILPRTYAGLGTNLSFYWNKSTIYLQKNNTFSKTEIKDNIWYTGAELFLRHSPWGNINLMNRIFLQASYQILWGNGIYHTSTDRYRYKTDNHTPFIGIGYKQPLAQRLNLGMLLSFKLNNEKDSPYSNPIIKISVEF